MLKKIFFYSLLLISPFSFMIIINEYSRPENPYNINLFGKRVLAYNSDNFIENQCTWNCHNQGCFHKKNNCINTDSTIISSLYKIILKLNGIDTIHTEPKSTKGDKYKTMNILFLVVLWPLFMFIMLVANIELYLKRKNTLK